ncbi:MAG: NAD(P)/FAD-dependent oxidoreductase [Crocinitomicaceae bacterium]
MNDNQTNYDIIIAGAGIAGNTLAKIFANNELNVLLIEQGKHPRFALGEAMLPQSALWPFMIGEYFNIEEIKNLSHADCIIDNVTPHCGIKHSFGFVYHEDAALPNRDTIHQLIPPSMPFYSESHLLREDVDQYLLNVALEAGVQYFEETKIDDIEIHEEFVRVKTNSGIFEGRYYIDSSGKNSLLAQKMGYRKTDSELSTQSRSIFTHVEGLEPFDNLLNESDHPGQNRKLHDGTLHHVFDGGWIWIIPFDNHERSESNLASIGLTLDLDKFPINEELSAEEEFYSIVNKFPGVMDHLKDIKNIRPWIRTGRLQYASNKSVGHRHMLTNNSYGFVDPLYSNGLVNTFETIFYTSRILLDAFDKNNFSMMQFEQLDKLHEKQLIDSDIMVSNAYRAMRGFKTWNAWTQLWLGQVLFHDLVLQRACFKYFETGDKSHFSDLQIEGRPGENAPFVKDKMELMSKVSEILIKFENGEETETEASEFMLEALKEQDWLPKHVYNWGDMSSRNVDFTNMALVGELIGWGMNAAPVPMRENLFDFKVPF